MNPNLQALCAIGTHHEALLGDQLILMQEFRTELRAVMISPRFAPLIKLLEDGVNVAAFNEDAWWTIVDDLKAYLGAQAANMAGNSRDDQESAIVMAETWVEDTISNTTITKILAVGVVLYGYAKVEAMLRELSSAVAA